MADLIKIKVNGMEKQLSISGDETLLDILRDQLDLTGAKEGCGYGRCGTCTVVVNGKAVTACTLRGKAKLDGIEVLTIEGLTAGFELHPIQQAFLDAGAVQCGFCTPGFVLRLYALFQTNLQASPDEIKQELARHLCRCTGYETIMDAALLAQQRLQAAK
jgi:carbon-monoxide dehydrogenase small subunit